MTIFYFIAYIDYTKEKIALVENSKVIVYRNEDNAKKKAKEIPNSKVETIELIEDTEFNLHFTIGD